MNRNANNNNNNNNNNRNNRNNRNNHDNFQNQKQGQHKWNGFLSPKSAWSFSSHLLLLQSVTAQGLDGCLWEPSIAELGQMPSQN